MKFSLAEFNGAVERAREAGLTVGVSFDYSKSPAPLRLQHVVRDLTPKETR